MELVSLLLVAATGLLFFYFLNKSIQRRRPPGPLCLPVIGSLFHKRQNEKLFQYSMRLKQQYGDIVYCKIGQQEIIYLNSYDVIKETLIDNSSLYAGRPNNATLMEFTYKHGILAAEGSLWTEHRRFALRVLRDFGFARTKSQEICLEECRNLVEYLQSHEGEPLELSSVMAKVVANVISCMCFDEHSGTDDENFDTYLENLQAVTQVGGIYDMLFVYFPMLRYIPGIQKLGVHSRKDKFQSMYNLINKKIEAHRATLSEDDNASPRDFLDAFLLEQRRRERSEGSDKHTFTDLQLLRVLVELFAAGTDTTANTLRWAILLTAAYPEHQTALFSEIEQVVGPHRSTMPSDRPQLHFLMAFLEEVQRWSTLVPLALRHRVTQDTTLHGYFISKDAFIMPNIYAVSKVPHF